MIDEIINEAMGGKSELAFLHSSRGEDDNDAPIDWDNLNKNYVR